MTDAFKMVCDLRAALVLNSRHEMFNFPFRTFSARAGAGILPLNGIWTEI
ncbi:hypothetical protein [Tritonibacter scottomollicae]|nr:hypothetical protein [Tritonibacter scottomollicae]